MSERDDYREKIDSLVMNWNIEFDEMEARTRMYGEEPDGDYDDVITELRQYRVNTTANH